MSTVAEPFVTPSPPSLRRSIIPLLIIALAIAAGFTVMGSFAMAAESAKAEMGLSDAALGIIQGGSAAVPLVLFSIPIGILVDRRNRVWLMIVMAAIWTTGTFLTAFAESAATLFLARMLAGIGTTGALTAALSLSADFCQPEERGRAMLIQTLGKSLGQAAAFAVTGWLIGMFAAANAPDLLGYEESWREAHVVLGIASALLILPMLLLREPARHEVEAGPNAPVKVVLRELWQRQAFLIPLFVGQTTVVMADAAAGIWAAPVLERSYGLKPAEFASVLGISVLVTGVVGSILGGIVADLGQKSGKRGGVLIGAILAAAVSVPAALFPIMPDATSNILLLGLLILCGTITGLVTSVALTVLLPNELRGLSIGAFIAIAGLIGFGIAPTLVTLVSQALGGEQHLAQALAIVGVLVSLVSVLGFSLARRHAPFDPLDHEG